MLGKTRRWKPRGPKGGQGTWVRLTKELWWRRQCPSPIPPPPSPSVICTLGEQRQDSTERAAAFVFSTPPQPPVPSVVWEKGLTLLWVGLSPPLPSQWYLRCIICNQTSAQGKGLCRLIGIYWGIFTTGVSQFPSTLPPGYPYQCLGALENTLAVNSRQPQR